MRSALLLLFVLAATTTTTRAADPITIEKSEPVIEIRRFDPKNLPDPAPPLQDGEHAICEYKFFFDSLINYQPTLRPGAPDIDLRVTGITLKLRLTITIWLPHDASPHLTAHEHGHRKIAEHFYQDAAAAARKASAAGIDKSFKLPAKDWEQPASKKINDLAETLCQTYLDAMNTPCGKAQEEYDRITEHSRNTTLTSDQAVKKVLKQQ